MTPILVFFHGLFVLGDEILPQAVDIIHEQMTDLKQCSLLDACSEFHVGINGGDDSKVFCDSILPGKAQVVLHGLQCRNENRTIQMMEQRIKAQHDEAHVLYFHAKGASFPTGDVLRGVWRQRMFMHCVTDWQMRVRDLNGGHDAVGCHWLTPEAYPGLVGHPYFAGTYWWAKASFLKTLPPISESPAVKAHGLDAFESRYEAESWIGHGPVRPKVRDVCPGWPM